MRFFYLITFVFISAATIAQSAFLRKNASISLSYAFPNILKTALEDDMQGQMDKLQSSGINADASIDYKISSFGPVFFKADIPLYDHLGIGPTFGYAQASNTYKYLNPAGNNVIHSTNTGSNRYDVRTIIMAFSCNYHMGQSKHLDPFIGLSLGYKLNFTSNTDSFDDPPIKKPVLSNPLFNGPDALCDPLSPLYFGFTIGLREYLTKNFGIHVAVGIDNWAFLQAGIVF